MADVAATVENIVLDNILTNSRILPQASRANNVLTIFAGGCFLAGILLLVYAFYLWILVTLGQLFAVVCTGVLLMLLAAACGFGMAFYRDRKLAQVRKEMSEALQVAMKLVKEDLGDVVQDNPKIIIATACLAGFVAGKKFL